MLLVAELADDFLARYKAIFAFLNDGDYPADTDEYGALRPAIFERIADIENDLQDTVGIEFLRAIKSAIFGRFIFLKRYKQGYVLLHVETRTYYQVAALTTPLELLAEEYSMVTTAIVPYASGLVCDGLIVSHRVVIGKNMMKEIRDGYWQSKRSGSLKTSA